MKITAKVILVALVVSATACGTAARSPQVSKTTVICVHRLGNTCTSWAKPRPADPRVARRSTDWKTAVNRVGARPNRTSKKR